MAGIIGHVLPIALGIAFSTVPIVVMILILLSPRGRIASLTYLIGAAIGLIALTTVLTLLASLLPAPHLSGSSPWIAAVEIVAGLGLLAIAAVRLVRARRHRGEPPRSTPAWMRRVSSVGPVPAFGVGLVLMLRPKNLLLTVAAGVAIGPVARDPLDAIVGIAVYVVLGLSTLAAPIIVAYANPGRTRVPLERAHAWLEANSALVSTIVLLVVGVVILGSGLTHV
ncbi:GAP family protein [Humibacter sp. BT305]|nr:GAP family protein [Humibacter sp. BT305]